MATQGKPSDLVTRLAARFKPLRNDSPELYEAFERIGMLITAKAKMNVRRYGMIDTGRLINSLRYETYKTTDSLGMKVGSFGTPYAAIHEFGGPFTEQMRRAMFADLGRRGRLKKGGGKGVIRNNYIPPRPYLMPAVNSSRGFIVSTLRKALGF
jgi:phage gpG-like protein